MDDRVERRAKVAASISALIAVVGIALYDVPSLTEGAAGIADPFVLVLGSFASDLLALVGAAGVLRGRRAGSLTLVAVNAYWVLQAVGALLDGEVALGFVAITLSFVALWLCLADQAAESGGVAPEASLPATRVVEWILTVAVVVAAGVAIGAVVLWATWRHDQVTRTWANAPTGVLVVASVVAVIAMAVVAGRTRAAVRGLTVRSEEAGTTAALRAFDEQLDGQAEPAAVLADFAATAAHLLRTSAIAIELAPARQHGSAALPGAWGRSQSFRTEGASIDEASARFEIVHRSDVLGVLGIGTGAAGRGPALRDRALAADVARHLGLIVASLRAEEALRDARERDIRSREEERRRIRHDLHDRLGPNLAGMMLQLGALRRSADDADGEVADTIAAIDSALLATSGELRRIVYDLRPPLLDEHGLGEALRNLEFVPSSLVLTVDESEPHGELPAALEVALHRVATEAIRNVVRHAAADRCDVRVVLTGESVTLTVIDDGRGFGAGTVPGVGMESMRERIDELGGLLTVSAGPGGRGCCVAATVPLGTVDGVHPGSSDG